MALVSYLGKNILSVGLKVGDPVRLLPGINEVEEDKLALAKQHPLFQSRLAAGTVVIMAESPTKDGKRPVDEMLVYIPKIYDTKLLKKIIDTDGRDRVIASAKEQLDKIKNPAKAKAEESDEHFQ